jgi:phenylalanyl-tRNA synthetase beta chain
LLSLPPIINSEHSKITTNTKNVFIEATATDLTKALIVLNQVVAAFSQYCSDKFTIERVRVVYEEDGKVDILPRFDCPQFETSASYISTGVGVSLSPPQIQQFLSRMQLDCKITSDDGALSVAAPITRPDILHAVDIMEDVAIAFGYNNIKKTVPQCQTVGYQQPINRLTDQMRLGVAQAGYVEVLTFALISRNENFDFLRRKDDGKTAVILDNSVTIGFDLVRSSLLPCMLAVLFSNKSLPLPLRVFEVSDVMLLDDTRDRGCRNERRVSAAYYGLTSGFEQIHGLLDRIMLLNEAEFAPDYEDAVRKAADKKLDEPPKPKYLYHIEPSKSATFFPGRGADVIVNGTRIGEFGILHPEVLKNFQLDMPCTVLELNLEYFL